MQLKAFRVQKFRNIEDSGEIELLDALTCVVGKNQAGKSALLRALHKFNPHLPAPYDMRREWPRGQRTKRNEKQVVCEVRFTLSPGELKKLGEIAGQELSGAEVVVTKNYAGNFEIQFLEDSTLFPDTLHPNSIDAICQNLPEPTEPVGENFRAVATKCILEAKRYATEGRFKELTQVRAKHAKALQRRLTEGDNEPQQTSENQFIAEYKTELKKFQANLIAESTKRQKAQDYIVSQLPTFIYMDDYKAFRGRADLESLKERLNNKKLTLSEEDETLLMILKLSSLDLDELIKQGESARAGSHPRSPSRSPRRCQDADVRRSRTLGPERVPGAVPGRRPGFLHRDRGDEQEHWDDPARGAIKGLPMVFFVRSALHARQRRNLRGLRAAAR